MTDLYQSSLTFSSSNSPSPPATSRLTANQVHAELRSLADSSFTQGKLFERVMVKYFMQAPLYREKLKNVQLWEDWAHEHGIDGRDVGIDLVADTHDGDYWAIQCKCYSETHTLQKSNIDSFLSSTGRRWGDEHLTFSEALVVSTTPRWSIHAEQAITGRTPPCIRLDLIELTEDEGVDWSALLPDLGLEKSTPRQLRPHQSAALDDVIVGFTEADRGQLIMACGTGKTYTALKIAEQQVNAGGRVLFMVPSLSLLSQTLREWAAHHHWDGIRTFAVCSDSKVGRTNEDINAYDMAIPPTTDGRKLADGLESELPAGHVQLVFATYHSISVVHDAQQRGAPPFDLVICDEAHRTTGVDLKDREASYYTRVHDNDYLEADKRLYMTATPRIYKDSAKKSAREKDQVAEIYSMDDADKYGDTFHRLDFSDAVAMDLLSDYKVLVLMVNQGHVNASVHDLLAMMEKTNLNDAAKIIGCWNALSKRIADEEALPLTDTAPMRRAVAFCQSIVASRDQVTPAFSDIVQAYRQGNPDDDAALGCTVQHVDGTQNALKRNQALQWLRDEPDENECRILSNVRCLSEGVDVPALDAVLFLSPRNSQVDVVQAVGRVMRKADGKDYGYIILPVCVNEDKSPEEALQDDKTYKVVWQVLQALRAHDNRFNAEINKIDLNKKREGRINLIGVGFGGLSDDYDNGVEDPKHPQYTTQLPINLQDWKDALYARLVLKCGDRRYWETWAKDVAEIAGRNITRITTLVGESDADYREIFEEFMAELRQNINPSVSEADAIEMLAQHLITRPVFDALFEGYSFIGSNPVSKTMQAMLELLDEQNLEAETASLQGFYDSVRRRASGIDNAEGRQKVVIELYEKFFKEAFPKMAESLGIVYTPVEIVDFILHSVNDLLVQEFGETLSSGNVHVLDPFTGTGTFLTRLLASGLIMDTDLERKYREELHANEIVLLAYYIAAVNIEETYHERLRARLKNQDSEEDEVKYESFPGIVLTDTFQINERDGDMLNQIFPVNSERVLRQKDTPIRVVLGNPPYSAGQSSANDNNANLRYPRLDESISKTYTAHTLLTNKTSLYDSYIRAFRWASDRIGNEGIVAYVSNGGWLDGNAMDGFRLCLAEEFSNIYCFNLRGNARTSGEQRRKEKGNVFGEGTRTNIAILVLVKKKGATGKCQIRYYDIGDYLDRKQKLDMIRDFGGIGNMEKLWRTISPNKYHDWINQRSEAFLKYMPLGNKDSKRNKGTVSTVFTLYSAGVKTGRDAWAYNFSKAALTENMQRTIAFYNNEATRYEQTCKGKTDSEKPDVNEFVNYDSAQIQWDSKIIGDLKKGKVYRFHNGNIRHVLYRPFTKQHIYLDRRFNWSFYQQLRFFPKPDIRNLAICVSGIGSSKDFSALMVDILPDLEIVSKSQCFPRYRYLPAERQERQTTLEMGNIELNREDNIRWETVARFREQYQDSAIDTDTVFYYVYGLLHSPDYKSRFSSDLKKMLPCIPLVASPDDFQAFSEAGKALAELHVGYEDAEGWPLTIHIDENKQDEQTGQAEQDSSDEEGMFRVKKMAFGGDARSPDKTTIRYNKHVTVEKIPLEAYGYIVNGKSAIEWVMERYQITQHKDSKIINDPNKWSDNPRYILELLQKVVTVSMKTVEIVSGLPDLDISE